MSIAPGVVVDSGPISVVDERPAVANANEGVPVLTPKDIPARERLIFPLDVQSFDEAKLLVETLGDAVHFYKLGLELLLAGGGFSGEYTSLLDWLVARDKKVMVDLKIFDIARTVRAALRQLKGHRATFVTVHGNDEILKAAAEEKNGVKILAVTVLTSMDQGDIRELGFDCDVESLVLARARRALQLGCDGVISSGLEAEQLRADLGSQFLIVVPGVRPVENRETEYTDDQKRIVDVEEAFRNGADYVLIGRPIRHANNPRFFAETIQQAIAKFFENQQSPS